LSQLHRVLIDFMQLATCRVIRDDRRHMRSFAELIAEPSAKLRIIDPVDD
jgi:hypothetical protein